MCILFVISQIIALPCTFVQIKYALCVALCVLLMKPDKITLNRFCIITPHVSNVIRNMFVCKHAVRLNSEYTCVIVTHFILVNPILDVQSECTNYIVYMLMRVSLIILLLIII